MPMYGSISEAMLQPKRYRWFTGVVLAPYLPWIFPSSWTPSSLPLTSASTGALISAILITCYLPWLQGQNEC